MRGGRLKKKKKKGGGYATRGAMHHRVFPLTKAGAECKKREGGKVRKGLLKIYQKAKGRKTKKKKNRRVRQLESHWKPLINKAQCWLQQMLRERERTREKEKEREIQLWAQNDDR